MRPIHELVVHHSASSHAVTFSDIELWHRRDRGWRAIGYHFVPG